VSDRPQEPAAPRGADPADRVREEGGSPSLVLWTGRIDQHVPTAGDRVGFWAAVYARFARHRGSVLAGGLAFFALLSLVPAFLSLGAVVFWIFSSFRISSAWPRLILSSLAWTHWRCWSSLRPKAEAVSYR
jgi:hypothetical protein